MQAAIPWQLGGKDLLWGQGFPGTDLALYARMRILPLPVKWLAIEFIVVSAVLGGLKFSTEAQAQPAISIDQTTQDFLKTAFDETKACSQLSLGVYDDIEITFMPPAFPCPHYPEGCNGEYVAPQAIKVGTLSVWRHEVLHYLLKLNTGSPDSAHESPLFKTCT